MKVLDSDCTGLTDNEVLHESECSNYYIGQLMLCNVSIGGLLNLYFSILLGTQIGIKIIFFCLGK